MRPSQNIWSLPSRELIRSLWARCNRFLRIRVLAGFFEVELRGKISLSLISSPPSSSLQMALLSVSIEVALIHSEPKIEISSKAHSLSKQCLHNLHFMKKGYSSPNLSKLGRADISSHFMKTWTLCRTVYRMNGF